MTKKILRCFIIGAVALAGCQKNESQIKPVNTEVAAVSAAQLKDVQVCIDKYASAQEGLTTNGAQLKSKTWFIGKQIKVKFMNGNSYYRNKVMKFAKVWEAYANISFVKVADNAKADIRIAFKFQKDPGSWSYLGRDALLIPEEYPTMNYGWFDEYTSDAEFRRVIVHEFGHALGLVHEQSSPGVDIKWNKPVVYAYFAGAPNYWSEQQVDYNLFYKYSKTSTQYSQFDPKSIMQYQVSKSFTLDGKGIGVNWMLSEMDKTFIATIYPKK